MSNTTAPIETAKIAMSIAKNKRSEIAFERAITMRALLPEREAMENDVQVHLLGAIPRSHVVENGASLGESVEPFFNWLQNGARHALDHVAQVRGSRERVSWEQLSTEKPPLAFLYAPSDLSRILIGAMGLSSTSAERPLALAACASITDPEVIGFSAALACGPEATHFIKECARAVRTARASQSWSEAFQGAHQIDVPDFSAAKDSARSFVENVAPSKGAAQSLAKVLLPGRDEPMSRAATFEELVRLVRTLGAHRRVHAVRLPLYAPRADATGMIWLAIVRAAARWRDHVPSTFWSVEGPDPWMQISLEEPAADMFSALWSDTSSEVWDLRRADTDLTSTRSDLRAFFENSDGTFNELLSLLSLESTG